MPAIPNRRTTPAATRIAFRRWTTKSAHRVMNRPTKRSRAPAMRRGRTVMELITAGTKKIEMSREKSDADGGKDPEVADGGEVGAHDEGREPEHDGEGREDDADSDFTESR